MMAYDLNLDFAMAHRRGMKLVSRLEMKLVMTKDHH